MSNVKKTANKAAEPKSTKEIWLEAQAALASAQKVYKEAAEAAAALPTEATTNPKPEHIALVNAKAEASQALSQAEHAESEADYKNVIEQIRAKRILITAAKMTQWLRSEGKSRKIFLAVVRFMAERCNEQFNEFCEQAGVEHDAPLFLSQPNVATRMQNMPAKVSATLDSDELLEGAYGKAKLVAHRTAATMQGTIREKIAHNPGEPSDDTAETSDIAYLSEVDSLDI